MKKIPTLFIRDPNNMARVTREVNPECRWIIEGEGTPTVKWDGSACLWQDGHWWKRYTLWEGKEPPPDFIPTGDPAPDTGKQAGWIPVLADDPKNKWHLEAAWNLAQGHLCYMPSDDDEPIDRTYELVGPKVQRNPYHLPRHTMLRHTDYEIHGVPREFDCFVDFFQKTTYSLQRLELDPHLQFTQLLEGIVWHHADNGRMAKIKRKDFGLKWPVTREESA